MATPAHWLDILTPEQERDFWRDLYSSRSEPIQLEQH